VLPLFLSVPRSTTSLSFFRNKLTSLIGRLTSGSNPDLRELNLGGNLIDSIKTQNFFNLKKLEVLRLNDNAMNLVQGGSFATQTALRVLDLSGNQLAFGLGDGLFDDNAALEEL